MAGPRSTWANAVHAMISSVARETTPPASAPAVLDAVACALLGVMPFGEYLVAARLDVGFLFLVGVTALAMAAVAGAGSAWGGLRAAAHVTWQHVPAAVALASIVLTTGSLRVGEIDRAQGGYPWDWLAFRSPGPLLALGVLLACAQIEPDRAPRPSRVERLVDDAGIDLAMGRNRWIAAACRAHRFILAGLAVTLFLGGWSLPGLTPEQQDARPALELAGAGWLLVKAWTVVLGLAALRLALPRRHLAEATRATTVWLVPLALVSFAMTAAWNWWRPERSVEVLVSGALVAIAGLAGLAAIQRVRHGILSPGGDGHLSPFL